MAKKNESREIANALKEVKKVFKDTSKEVSKLLRDDPEVAKGIESLKNQEIPILILYQLYWYSNKNWIISCSTSTETSLSKVECVRLWRELRDACDNEITRREKI